MTRDNQVIKMNPFSTSDTRPLWPHLNNKSTLRVRSQTEKEGVGVGGGRKQKQAEHTFTLSSVYSDRHI